MTENIVVLFICLGIILVLAINIYMSNRSLVSSGELRLHLERIGARVHSIEHLIREQRGALNDAHKKILAVTKALEKRPSSSPQNKQPDLTDPAVPKPVPCGNIKFAGLGRPDHTDEITARYESALR